MDDQAFADFQKMAFKSVEGQKASFLVYCEDCGDTTTITNGKATCGHVPQWLKDVRAWLNSRDSSQ